MFSLICAWINDWVNNGGTGDLRRHSAHYDVTVIITWWQRNASRDPHHWPSPVSGGFLSQSPGQQCDALVVGGISCLTNNRVAGDLRFHDAHVISVWCIFYSWSRGCGSTRSSRKCWRKRTYRGLRCHRVPRTSGSRRSYRGHGVPRLGWALGGHRGHGVCWTFRGPWGSRFYGTSRWVPSALGVCHRGRPFRSLLTQP